MHAGEAFGEWWSCVCLWFGDNELEVLRGRDGERTAKVEAASVGTSEGGLNDCHLV